MSDPIKRELEPRFIVLRRSNGHFESIGPTVQAYNTKQEAADRAVELRNQHREQVFVVFSLIQQFAFELIPSEGEVKEP